MNRRCDEGGEVGSPICMRDAPGSSSTSPPWPSSSPWYWTVELHGGSGPKEGNVYANNRNGDFGPVCDHGWTDVEATVVCRLVYVLCMYSILTHTSSFRFNLFLIIIMSSPSPCPKSQIQVKSLKRKRKGIRSGATTTYNHPGPHTPPPQPHYNF